MQRVTCNLADRIKEERNYHAMFYNYGLPWVKITWPLFLELSGVTDSMHTLARDLWSVS
jgi:hypothetical protein